MSIQAQQYPVFQNAMRIITNITNANPAVITTSFAHQYETGLIVRLILPPGYGMYQANQALSDITVIDSVTFSMNLDTLQAQYAQVIPVGEVNSTVYLAYKNVLPYRAV